jgi:hypothetical protein
MAVMMSVLRAIRFLLPWNIFLLFLVLISVRGLVQLEGLGKLKIFNDLIGTQTCDLQASSIVPQPTMLMYVHLIKYYAYLS